MSSIRAEKAFPIPEPVDYDPAEFELYRRALNGNLDIFSSRKMRYTLNLKEAKKHPFVGGANLNRNLMASTAYGCNVDYPNGRLGNTLTDMEIPPGVSQQNCTLR